jgi:cyclic-di-AMP phosphodiesterase PgpH
MKKILIYISNSHENILKGILIVVSMWLLATMLPHKVRYKFDIKNGKVWNYEDLTAPFDFAIQKNVDSLKAEKLKAAYGVLPYFFLDTNVVNVQLTEFERKVLADTFSLALKNSLVEVGKQILTEVYDKGIIRLNDIEQPGPEGRLMLVQGKTAIVRYTEDFFIQNSARSFAEQRTDELVPDFEEVLTPIVISAITTNIFYDSKLTEEIKLQQQDQVASARGMVRKGDLIISNGQQVTPDKYLILESLRKVTETTDPDEQTTREIYWSQFLVIAISLSMLLLFLGLLRKDIFVDNRKIALILTLIILVVGAYTGIMKMHSLSEYVIPLCILPVVIRVFFDTRLALFSHVITVLILGSVAPNGYEFVFMQIIAGMVTIFSVTNLRKRAQLFVSAGLILVSYVITYLALGIIHEGSLRHIEIENLYWLVGNVLLTLFAYPLIYVFEKIFGLTSDISLMELSDTNSPLLRELSIKAPGTFQHTMQVANLAEAAAFKIGGNTLLVRVGALYHDIGKMDMALYFIENQSTGVNPHDELAFEESASIIISHVVRGIEKARKNKIPDLIIDFIRTHHGTTMVQYFYQSYLKNYPEEIVDEEDFRYPGPLPFSKETAILMMADSVEAASRSLVAPNSDAINKLVDSIIDRQIQQQQFINCDITFKDISSIKKIFKKMLMSVYHVRVEYPGA